MDKLAIEDCEKAIAALGTSQMKNSILARSLMDIHKQLLDTMRENEALRKHPPMIVCKKCNHINTIHPYKESDNG